MLNKKKVQSILEYVLLIGIVMAAIVGMQSEIRKALQGRYHDSLQYLQRETADLGNTFLWEPSTGVRTITNQVSTRNREEYYENESDVWTKIVDSSRGESSSWEIK